MESVRASGSTCCQCHPPTDVLTGFDNAGLADAIDAGAISNLLPALSVYLKVFAKERFPKLSMF